MSKTDNKDTQQDAETTVKKNIFWQYLLQLAIYIFPFITLPYLTRVLGPEEFAVRAYSISILNLLFALIDFGFNPFGIREIARNRTNLNFMSALTSSIFLQRIALSLLGAIILLVSIPAVPIMANNPDYMLIAYVGTVLTALLPDFVFRGLEDMSILTTRFVVSRLVSIILIFTFVHSADQLLLVAVFEAVPSLIAFVWSWVEVHRKFKIHVSLKIISMAESLKIFKSSFVFFLSTASTTIFTNLTTVLIGIYIASQADISYWSLAITVVAAIQALFNPIFYSIYPHIAATHNFSLVKKYLFLGMPLVIVGCVALYFLSPLTMILLGGEDYIAGAPLLQFLIPTILFSYPAIIMGYPILAVLDKEKQLTTSSVVAAIFNIVGLLLLALFGVFTLAAVAILRSITEFILLFMRLIFIYQQRHNLIKQQPNHE